MKKIVAYEAADGTLFKSEQAAQEYSATKAVEKAFCDSITLSRVTTITTVLNFIRTNSEPIRVFLDTFAPVLKTTQVVEKSAAFELTPCDQHIFDLLSSDLHFGRKLKVSDIAASLPAYAKGSVSKRLGILVKHEYVKASSVSKRAHGSANNRGLGYYVDEACRGMEHLRNNEP